MKITSQKYIFYINHSGKISGKSDLPAGYYLKIWQPSILGLSPKGLPKFPFILWSIMHYLKLFRNSNYRIFLVYYNKRIVHYSVVLSKHFKYPFMDNDDIQIGPCWTNIEHRRKGIASYAIKKIVEAHKKSGRKFWYVTREENIPSKKFIESLGFLKYGIGFKKRRGGIGALGYFFLEHKY